MRTVVPVARPSGYGDAMDSPRPLRLRGTVWNDLDVLFAYQRDPESVHMAAFTVSDPDDRDAFDTRWRRLFSDPSIDARTVTLGDEVVGSVIGFDSEGLREVSYWLGRRYWGFGLATAALSRYLADVATRPLHARTAADNTASRRVLTKCGFTVVGAGRGFAAGRGAEIAEDLWRLDGPGGA